MSWLGTNATSCTASGGWSGSRSPSGTETIGPLTGSGSVVLTCSGAGGTANATFSYTVAPPSEPQAPPPFPEPLAPGAIQTFSRQFNFGFGNGVQDIESDPAQRRVYLSFRNSIVVLSADTYLVDRVVPIGATPAGIALSADGLRLYVALANGGAVAILDTQTYEKTTVEVAVEVGTPFITDVLEVQPGVVLASGLCFYQSNCNAYLVTVDTNNGNARRRVAGGRRVWNGPSLRLSHDRRYVYLDGGTDQQQQALRLDNGSAELPVDLEGPALSFLGHHFELNSSDNMIVTGGGVVMNAANFSRLLTGSVDGHIGYDDRSHEVAFVKGGQLYVLDAETLVTKNRYLLDCGLASIDALEPAGLRGEWVIAYAGNDVCVVSTQSPTTPPGAAGSRQWSTSPPQQNLPTIETFVGRVPGGMAADFARDLFYVSSTELGGVLAVDATAGGIVGFLPITGALGEVRLAVDGSRLVVARTDRGAVVVIDVASWSIEREVDLEPPLGRDDVELVFEISASQWLALGRYDNSDPTPPRYVLFDPGGATAPSVVADTRGYCGGKPFMSRDGRFLYLTAANCVFAVEKRDLGTAGWPIVASSDPTHGLHAILTSESNDGTRLYLNEIAVSSTTLRQNGRFQASGLLQEVPSGNSVVSVSGSSVSVFDRNEFDRTAGGTGVCVSYIAEGQFSWAYPVIWPDFSRAAILGLGTLNVEGGVCVFDLSPLSAELN